THRTSAPDNTCRSHREPAGCATPARISSATNEAPPSLPPCDGTGPPRAVSKSDACELASHACEIVPRPSHQTRCAPPPKRWLRRTTSAQARFGLLAVPCLMLLRRG